MKPVGKSNRKTQRNPREACLDLIGDDAQLVFIDGHDDAIMGMAERDGEWLVVYDVGKILKLLRIRDGMTREDAHEFYAYNIAGAGVGAQSPIFVSDISR